MQRQFISYPKSGRTWIRYALSLTGQSDNIEFHHDTFEFNDGSRPSPNLDFQDRLAKYRSIEKVVYLSRDPRDILVSLFFQVTGRFKDFFEYKGNISEFIRDEYFGAQHLKEFQRQWEDICGSGIALKVSYEDCHEDLGAVLRRILTHYEMDVSEASISNAVAEASLERMRRVEQSGKFERPWLQLRNNAPKVRRGIVGGYRDYLSHDDIQYLDALFGKANAPSGSGYPVTN